MLHLIWIGNAEPIMDMNDKRRQDKIYHKMNSKITLNSQTATVSTLLDTLGGAESIVMIKKFKLTISKGFSLVLFSTKLKILHHGQSA